MGRSATVVAVDLNEDGLATLAGEAATKGCLGRLSPERSMLTDRAAVDALIEEVMEQCGKINILVNNAGITRDGLLMNMEDDQFDTVLNVNLRRYF